MLRGVQGRKENNPNEICYCDQGGLEAEKMKIIVVLSLHYVCQESEKPAYLEVCGFQNALKGNRIQLSKYSDKVKVGFFC